MAYRTLVFNQNPVAKQGLATALMEALRKVHFESLCQQYGLDTGLIEPALYNLSVEVSLGSTQPLFLLHYQNKDKPPIIVSEWECTEVCQRQILGDVVPAESAKFFKAFMKRVKTIYTVELERSQLTNLGLLLAYEVVRWLAAQGTGLVFGLDRAWYRLNKYHAFILLK
jgi:hypothetical protein